MCNLLKFSIVVSIMAFFTMGCQEKYERIVPPVDIVGELVQDAPTEGGTYYLSLTYNGDVTIDSNSDWCTAEYQGTGSNNIKITVAPNDARKRSALVTIKTFSNPTIKIQINQAGQAVTIVKPKIMGNWQFNDPDNFGKATTGANLELKGSGIYETEGVNGGTAAEVLKGSYFLAKHGIAANGGGAKVNNYTIMMDFKLPAATRACFLQTDLANSNDVDIFLRANMYQLGIGNVYCDLSANPIQANVWYRLVICAELGQSLRYYLNGVEVLNHDGTGDAGLDSRLALDPAGVLLFADEDGEDENIHVAQVTIWDQPLQAADAIALGAAGSNDYLTFPGPLVGKWSFNNPEKLGAADLGNDLILVGNSIWETEGPNATNKAASVGKGSYLRVKHGISASGETASGDPAKKVNEYSILYDFMLPAATRACFLQTDMTNSNDVDIFLRANMYQLGIGNVYCDLSANPIQANVWYRLVICAKLGESLRYYLNGVEVFNHDGTGDAGIDSRLALDPTGVLLFADEDGEDEEIHVAAAAMWNKALSAAEAAALGTVGSPIE